MNTMAAGLLALCIVGSPAFAQEEGPAFPPGQQPAEFDQIIQQMKFEKPTRIVGRLKSLDGYEDAIWIDWTHVHDGTHWREIRNEMMFKVLPRDADMMEFFKRLTPGTTLHMTIQMDPEGNRRVLELEGT